MTQVTDRIANGMDSLRKYSIKEEQVEDEY